MSKNHFTMNIIFSFASTERGVRYYLQFFLLGRKTVKSTPNSVSIFTVKKCRLYAVVHIFNLNKKGQEKKGEFFFEKKRKEKKRSWLSFNCNAYIINKCKGGKKEKVQEVLQAILDNSSMAETISGLESKSYMLECDRSFYKTLFKILVDSSWRVLKFQLMLNNSE